MTYCIFEQGKRVLKKTKGFSEREDLVDAYFLCPSAIKIENPNKFWQFFHDKTLSLNAKRNDPNAIICREIELGLHNELTLEENKKIIKALISECLPKDVIADVAIHKPKNTENLHAHILLTDREIDENLNFSKKHTIWGKRDFFKTVRAAFERISNDFLPEDRKISMLSYEEQIIIAEEMNLKFTSDNLREKRKKRRKKIPISEYKKLSNSEKLQAQLHKEDEGYEKKRNSDYSRLHQHIKRDTVKTRRCNPELSQLSSSVRNGGERTRQPTTIYGTKFKSPIFSNKQEHQPNSRNDVKLSKIDFRFKSRTEIQKTNKCHTPKAEESSNARSSAKFHEASRGTENAGQALVLNNRTVSNNAGELARKTELDLANIRPINTIGLIHRPNESVGRSSERANNSPKGSEINVVGHIKTAPQNEIFHTIRKQT